MSDLSSNEEIKKLFPTIRSADEFIPVEVIPTPLPKLNDIVFGCGGIPRGRSIELYGATSAGKTTIALNLIAWAQKLGCRTVWDDREGTFPDETYTFGIGLDREQVTMMDTGDGNDALYQCELMLALNIADLYVIDSLAMILPKNASVVGDTEEMSMHQKLQRASLLTGFFQKLRSGYYIGNPGTIKKDGTYNLKDLVEADKQYIMNGKLEKYLHKLTDKKTALIMINHYKIKPGVHFGNLGSTPGGDATKFDASVRILVQYKKKSKEKIKGLPAFKIIQLKAEKNKVAPPFGEATFILNYDGSMEQYDRDLKSDTDIEEVTSADFEQ